VLLTVAEAARRLRQSPVSVYRRVADGQLPALRVGEKGPLRIEEEALERLLRPANTSERST
jgi:excisionase family DNA binding protein